MVICTLRFLSPREKPPHHMTGATWAPEEYEFESGENNHSVLGSRTPKIQVSCHGSRNFSQCADKSIIFVHGATATSRPGTLHYRGFTITLTPRSIGLLWTSGQPDDQKTTLTKDKHLCPRPDSNQST